MSDPRPLKLDDMGGGTPCAKVDQEPRYVSILYPTDQPLTDADKLGEDLLDIIVLGRECQECSDDLDAAIRCAAVRLLAEVRRLRAEVESLETVCLELKMGPDL